MAIVYPTKKSVFIKIGEVTFKVMPLSRQQKLLITEMIYKDAGSIHINLAKSTYEMMRMMIKGVDGLKNPDGSAYELKFKDNLLTDDCLDDLSNVVDTQNIQMALKNFLTGVPSKLYSIIGESITPLKGAKVLQEKDVPKSLRES